MRQKIVVNCENLPFQNTLGVAGFLLRLGSALSADNDIIFAMKDVSALESAPTRPWIEKMSTDIISLDEARSSRLSSDGIEIAPHHFQLPNICRRSILICHDMHVFDIGWKYANVESVRAGFRRNLQQASVVMSEFPRTFYDVERIAGASLRNLYLTESPLLLDTTVTRKPAKRTSDPFLIYPAQLQAHKNHKALILAAAKLREEGFPCRIICCGSDFTEALTTSLKQLVAEHNVTENIEFLGRISDDELISLYRRCSGVIIPSMAEGGAYVAFEGIAAGKPVAVNDITSARKHLKMVQGEVIWFNSSELASTAGAVRALLDGEADDHYKRNATARKRIATMTWGRVANQFQAVVDWLGGQRGRPQICVDADGWNIQYS